MKARVLASLAVLGVACATQRVRDERFSAAAEEHAVVLRQQIRDEIARSDSPPWAGEYYEGDGMGENVSLLLAPESGFLFEWRGCLGTYDRNFGPVDESGGRILVTFTYENCREGFRGLAPAFVPVPWGERLYLVEAEAIVDFCNEVNGGSEPRTHVNGNTLLRRGDEGRPAPGWPEVPAEYRSFLLSAPVAATIVALGPSVTRAGRADTQWTQATLIIDAGSRQGLARGMELFVTEPDDLVQRIRLTEVEEERSSGVAVYEDKWSAPTVGMRVSTRAPWESASASR
jgi:hypothetical protein